MDLMELSALKERTRLELEAIKTADTPENEARLIAALASLGVKITRLRLKTPQRYRVKLANGSIERSNLLDLERMLAKLSSTT